MPWIALIANMRLLVSDVPNSAVACRHAAEKVMQALVDGKPVSNADIAKLCLAIDVMDEAMHKFRNAVIQACSSSRQ